MRCGIHPSLKRPVGSPEGPIHAAVLMMVGSQDPLVPVADRERFAGEMESAEADWQLHVFGGVGHSFTNPGVNELARPGFAYDALADRRATALMLASLEETLSPAAEHA